MASTFERLSVWLIIISIIWSLVWIILIAWLRLEGKWWAWVAFGIGILALVIGIILEIRHHSTVPHED